MEPIIKNREDTAVLLFNSQLETGVRALFILNESYPKTLDLTKLTWLDHLVVHTGDIDGPASLHPNVPQRSGEILVRRRLIEDSLNLMRRLHLVSICTDERGLAYQATEEAYPVIDLMRTSYATELKERAKWLVENVCSRGDEAIHDLIENTLGRWNVEFQEISGITRG